MHLLQGPWPLTAALWVSPLPTRYTRASCKTVHAHVWEPRSQRWDTCVGRVTTDLPLAPSLNVCQAHCPSLRHRAAWPLVEEEMLAEASNWVTAE